MNTETKQPKDSARSILWRRIRIVLLIFGITTIAGLAIYHASAWRTLCHSMARRAVIARNFENAKTWLLRVELVASSDAETALLRCGLARRSGNAEEFAAVLSLAEQRGASGSDIQRERTLFAAAAGQIRLAEPHLPRLLQEEEHDNIDVCRSFINGYIKNQRLHRALPLIEAWMKDAPEDPEPFCIRGQIRFQRSEFVEAERDFTEALRIDPDYTDASVSLAAVHLKLGKPKEAETLLAKLQENGHATAQSQIQLVECFMMQRRTADAEQLLDALLASDSGNLDALHLKAQLEFDTKNFDEALDHVERVLAQRPRKSKARYLRAKILQNLSRTAESEAEMAIVTRTLNAESELQVQQQKISETPEDPDLLVKAAGLLQEVMEDNTQAIFALQAAIDLQPDHKQALSMLADVYAQSPLESDRQLEQYYRSKLAQLAEGR